MTTRHRDRGRLTQITEPFTATDNRWRHRFRPLFRSITILPLQSTAWLISTLEKVLTGLGRSVGVVKFAKWRRSASITLPFSHPINHRGSKPPTDPFFQSTMNERCRGCEESLGRCSTSVFHAPEWPIAASNYCMVPVRLY
jgi:hypothetical protein